MNSPGNTPLSAVATVRSGYSFKSKDWVDIGVPVVKIANVKSGEVDLSGCSYLPESFTQVHQEFVLIPGDIIIAMTGYVGDVAKVRSETPLLLNQRVGRFEVLDSQRLDQDYLFYFLRLEATKRQFEQLAHGSAQANISPSQILSVEIPLPPLDEQRRIAHILGTLDDKIELNRQMNKTLDEIARTLFRSWFVDFDPVRAKMEGRQPEGMDAATAALFPDRLVESELGLIPEGWEWGTLSDVADNVRDNIKTEELDPDEIYVGLEHFERRHMTFYRWGNAADLASGKSRFVEGDILFGKLRPYFHKVAIAPIGGVCSTEIFVIRPKRSSDHGWVSAIAISDEMIDHATQRSSGTRMPRANWNDVGGFTVAIPNLQLRDSFERVTRPMLDMVKTNGMESRSLADLRDTLLPGLLSNN